MCATPPSLENGVLKDIPTADLLCGEGEDAQEALVASPSAPVKGHINLQRFFYNGRVVTLVWEVQEAAVPYSCDAIFVYEEEGPNEVLVGTTPLSCNSSLMQDPGALSVAVPNSENLLPGHKYRYCVVLLQSSEAVQDDLFLVLGCSDVIPLVDNTTDLAEHFPPSPPPNVTSIFTSVTQDGLTVAIAVNPRNNCEVNLAVFQNNALLTQKKVNCTNSIFTFGGLMGDSYRVCANVLPGSPGGEGLHEPVCVKVAEHRLDRHTGWVSILTFFGLTVGVCFSIVGCVVIKNSKPRPSGHKCFTPPENEGKQHNKYIKLQATTKL